MVTKEITLSGRQGLESKPAAIFIQKASNFKSTIWVEKNDRRVNAKSLLGLLSLAAENGNKVTIIAEGEDEQLAVNELSEFLKNME